MQHTDQCTVSRIYEESTSKTLIVMVNWCKTSFDLTIFDGTNAYSGTMTEDAICEIIRHLGTMTIEDYIDNCKTALSAFDKKAFVFKLDNNRFHWKKIEHDIRITFGSIHITTVPVLDALANMLQIVVTNNYKLSESVSSLSKENTQLELDKKVMLDKVSECIDMKTNIEMEMYNQFLVVLNTKKKKILQLEKLLKENNIEVADVAVEEDAKDTITSLYECDTEVDTESDDSEDDKTTSQNKSRIELNSEPMHEKLIDSDSEENAILIPKRSKMTNKRENIGNNVDEEAGPSGVKLSKVEESCGLDNKNKCVSETANDIRNSEVSANFKDAPIRNNLVISNKSNNSSIEKLTNETPRTNGSDIDDILAHLIG